MVVVMLVGATFSAAAQDMQGPRLSHIDADWTAAAADLEAVTAPDAAAPDDPTHAAGPEAPSDAAPPTSLDGLSQATGDLFAGIATSPVPVLLPFDTATYLRDRAAGTAKPVDQYLAGFHLSPFFLPGPSGYDAMLTTRAAEMPELGIGFSGQIRVFISGLSLLYDLDEPVGTIGWPTRGLDGDIPGIRRFYLENYVRYTFTRYGVPYVVSILCFDGRSRYHMISCVDAGKIATRFIKALHLAGGLPPRSVAAAGPIIDRPAATSPVFTYRSPGGIIPGTGMKGRGGRTDYTVYSKMRFPLAETPAYANSQSFMNWGNCDMTGRVSLGMVGRVPAYRCRIGGPDLVNDESAAGNYTYPWRDDFCEHRYFDVGQCPSGLGHQGQDIRPSSCKQRIEGANRCEPYQHDAVAVRDGMVLRPPGEMPVYLFVNAPDEHIRFRYLHMSPRLLDQDGVLTGRVLREGESFGKVGNYFGREGATSYHLHFDMQVPTRYGWVFVSPYMTLVAAYERLLGARGTEIKEESLIASVPLPPERSAAAVAAIPAEPGENGVQSEGDDRIESPGPVAPEPPSQAAPVAPKAAASLIASLPANLDVPRLGVWRRAHLADIGAGANHAGAVRPMGRGFSRASLRARNIRHDLLASHARLKAGHHRL
jgi:hypothetical protein